MAVTPQLTPQLETSMSVGMLLLLLIILGIGCGIGFFVSMMFFSKFKRGGDAAAAAAEDGHKVTRGCTRQGAPLNMRSDAGHMTHHDTHHDNDKHVDADGFHGESGDQVHFRRVTGFARSNHLRQHKECRGQRRYATEPEHMAGVRDYHSSQESDTHGSARPELSPER